MIEQEKEIRGRPLAGSVDQANLLRNALGKFRNNVPVESVERSSDTRSDQS